MTYELKDIKEIRKKINLTQTELAKKSGVSQSLIAKIEAGRLDPTYTKALKIFNTLDTLSKEKEVKAEEIMTKKIITVSPDSDVQDIIKKIRKYNISQIPVIDKDKSVGIISEANVLDALMQGKKDIKAKNIMKETPPTISKTAPMTVVSNLLKFYPIVFVEEQGKLLGVITKADVLGSFTEKSKFKLF